MAANKYIPEEDRTDHLGNVFDSVKAMCISWNQVYSTYISRIKNGISKEEALTKTNRTNIEDRTDHLGNVFSTIREMCNYWGINKSCYIDRVSKGWSKEKALTQKSRKQKIKDLGDCTDHLGNTFNSIREMCDYWGITDTTYHFRLKQGYTKEEALTGNYISKALLSNLPEEERTDHLGNVYISISDMCKKYNCDKALFYNRRKLGWSIIEALGVIPRLSIKTVGVQIADITIIRKAYISDGEIYFFVQTNDTQDIMSKNDIIKYFIEKG